MKIIKRNKKHLGIECDHCGSILDPSKKDIQECTEKCILENSIVDIHGESYIKIITYVTQWIKCPVCGKNIQIKHKSTAAYVPYQDYLEGRGKN